MNSRRRAMTWAGLITLGVVLLVVFMEVMERRFVEGDIYPYYASFRSDPLGTSALYETLSGLPQYEVSRNVTNLNSLSTLDANTTLLLLGYPRDDLSELRAPENSPVMEAVKEGARLVLTINPELVPEKFRPLKSEEEEDWLERRRQLREERLRGEKGSRREAPNDNEEGSDEEIGETDESAEDKSDSGEDEEGAFEVRMASMFGPRLTEHLDFEVNGLEEFERPKGGWETKKGKSFTAKRSDLVMPSWYSQYRLETESAAWYPVVKVEGKPVVMERRWGKGSVVIATDSFFVSNEALHREAVPEFLIWMVGDKKNIVFDETIHGTLESGGTMKLIRHYRLHGLFLGMVVFVALWAWRSGSTLAPGNPAIEHGFVSSRESVGGLETGRGLIHLLKKSIPRNKLLDHCFEIWRLSYQRDLAQVQEKKVSKILKRHQSNPKQFGATEAFREMTEALRKR